MDCPHFHRQRSFVPSREIHPSGQVSGGVHRTVQWCAHPASPCRHPIAHSLLDGGARLLQCEGDISRCQVPPDRR
jgi:hypothetical protein